MIRRLFEGEEDLTCLDFVSRLHFDRFNLSILWRRNIGLHFHRFEDKQHVILFHGITLFYGYLQNNPVDW